MQEGNEGGQPGQAPGGGVPSVGPGRGGKPLTGVDGTKGRKEVEFAEGLLEGQNRGRLGRVADWFEQRGWEIVLVTELFGEGEEVI